MGIGASVFLLAAGAILAFAVTIDDTLVAGITVDWATVGVILMIVGALGLLWSMIAMSTWREDRRRRAIDEQIERDRIMGR